VSPWKIAAVKMEQLALEFGFVCLTDAREIAKEVGGHWNASTMLNRFFNCTREPVGGTQQKRWKLTGWDNRTPSALYPEVAKEMPCE
jgi:hypothetical protein